MPYSSTTIYQGEIHILSELYHTIVSSKLTDNNILAVKEKGIAIILILSLKMFKF